MSKANARVAILLSSLVYFASSSCETVVDPGVNYTQVIENGSEENLLLVTSIVDDTVSVIIPPDGEYVLLNAITIGHIRGYKNCETEYLGELSLKVESSDSLIVNINPNQSASWQFTIFEEGSNGGGTGECRLVIDDQNIE